MKGLDQLESFIENIPDFPQKGIIFKDITPLLREHFHETLSHLANVLNFHSVDAICGIDARGFILGAGMASLKKIGFIPIRKKGKLPPPTITQSYQLEYGQDTLEIKKGQRPLNVILVDDVLATGGTLKAAIQLCEKSGLKVVDIGVLIDLKFLNRFESEGISVKSLFQYH